MAKQKLRAKQDHMIAMVCALMRDASPYCKKPEHSRFRRAQAEAHRERQKKKKRSCVGSGTTPYIN